MTVDTKRIFEESAFGHVEELGFKPDEFSALQMQVFGDLVAEAQRKADETDAWHTPAEKPVDGANILCYHWYDGPHYFPAVYNAKHDEAEFELPSDDSCPLGAVDKWMYIPEIVERKTEEK